MRKYVILICFFYNLLAFAQTDQFRHITSHDGLSQSEIYCFLEDSRGFMWFGSLDGLNRYDGYNIKVFNTDRNSINSIPNNTIRALAEDNYGRIWIGTDNGLCIYNPNTEKISQINSDVFNSKLLQISTILIDKDHLLLGTTTGLFSAFIGYSNLDEIDFKQIQLTNDKNSSILSIKKAKDGAVWIAEKESIKRLFFKEIGSPPIVIDSITDKNWLSDIRNMEEDRFGNLWIVTQNMGLYRYSSFIKKLTHFSESNPILNFYSDKCSSVIKDKTGNLWIGTRDKGLVFIDSKYLNDENPKFKIIQNSPLNSRSLNSNLIFSLYASKDNLIWIGTIGSGVNIYNLNQKKFNYYGIHNESYKAISGSNFVRSIYVDTNDDILTGIQSSGLFLLNREEGIFKKLGFETESIYYIDKGPNGNLFICSELGLYLVNIKDRKLKILSKFYNNAVFNVVSCGDNKLWVACIDGLRKCKIVDNQIVLEGFYNTNSNPSISNNNCRTLHLSKRTKELYVGTEGGGLNVLKLDDNYDPVNICIYKQNKKLNSLSNNYTRAIVEDDEGSIWIGTYEGLNKIINNTVSGEKTFKTYSKKDGLSNNLIQSIVEDDKGNLWIGTNQGLCKFDSSNESFIQYYLNDGIQSNEFSEDAVFKKNDGEIIIGGVNGINTFYPDNIIEDPVKPKTNIVDFFLFNNKVDISNNKEEIKSTGKSITLTDSISLSPNQNNFGLNFSAMLFSNPEKIRYAYMLEGFDKDWLYTDSKNRRATYTNLNHGEYVFKVKSTNQDGIWEEEYRSVHIHIKTPLYKTKFAVFIYILLFVILLVYLTKYSIIKYTTKNKILLESEHNKRLHEVDKLRARFFVNVSHDLRTPLTLISSPLDIVLKNNKLKPDVRIHLERMKNNVKKLRHITEQLLDIRKVEGGRLKPKLNNHDIVSVVKNEVDYFITEINKKNIKVGFFSSADSIKINVDKDMISKVIFNIISNALKFTHKGEININITIIEDELPEELNHLDYNEFVKIEIQDSGVGISELEIDRVFERFYQAESNLVEGYGVGLSHCKDLVEAHSGIIKVSSEVNFGTTFSVFIPFINVEIKEVQMDGESYISNTMDSDYDVFNNNQNKKSLKEGYKILLVEDNSEMRTFIKNELENEYEVYEAEDGQIGLNKAGKHSIDIIISDIMMPNMDGVEFCKQIKSNIKTSHIPVILLTAKVDTQTKYEGIKKGADDYISKPFDMEYLQIRIRNLINNRTQLRRLFQLDSTLEPSSITFTSLDEQFMSSLVKSLEEGILDSNFSISSLETQLGMSHSNFYRKVKSLTGQSAKEILFGMRMKRAKQILTDNKDMRVSEVAYMVGFSNPKYFSKCFKEYHGILPTTVK